MANHKVMLKLCIEITATRRSWRISERRARAIVCIIIILSFAIFICLGRITNYELNARLGFVA